MQLKISEVEFAHDLNVEPPYLAREQPATEHVDICTMPEQRRVYVTQPQPPISLIY